MKSNKFPPTKDIKALSQNFNSSFALHEKKVYTQHDESIVSFHQKSCVINLIRLLLNNTPKNDVKNAFFKNFSNGIFQFFSLKKTDKRKFYDLKKFEA